VLNYYYLSDIERAENRALRRCPVYNEHNKWWQHVSTLEEKNVLVKEATKKRLSTLKKKQLSVNLFNNDSQGNEELSSCKKAKGDSWPVSLVSYNNLSASNRSGLTLGQVCDQEDSPIATSNEYNVASSVLQLDDQDVKNNRMYYIINYKIVNYYSKY
jgi:hypothetical protein